MEYSIIATSFNDAIDIERFIASIKAFTVLPKELVIVDGGSKDNTEELLIKCTFKCPWNNNFLFDKKRRNISQGYNEAIRLCNSEHILILGIGNTYANDYADKLIRSMKNNKCDIAYGSFIGIDSNKFSKTFNRAFLKGNKSFDYGQASNRGALVKKSIFEKAGYFYEKFVYAGEDTEFYSRVANLGISQVYQKDAVVKWSSPISLGEFRKKMRVNAIADMQILKNINIFKKLVALGLSLVVFLVLLILDWPLVFIYIILLLGFAAYKIECVDLSAQCLWISSFYITGYFYIRELKYLKNEYNLQVK